MCYNAGNNKCFPLKPHLLVISSPFTCLDQSFTYLYKSLLLTWYHSAIRDFTLEYKHLQRPNSHFSSFPKKQKILLFSHQCCRPNSPNMERQSEGLSLAAPLISCSVICICPMGSSLVPLSVYLELADVQNVNSSIAQNPAGTQLPDFAFHPMPTWGYSQSTLFL